MNKVQAATHDNNQYKIISTNATDLRVAAEIEGEFEHKKEILDIIDLIQKKHKNEQEEEEEQTSHKKGKNEDKNKKESEKEDEEDENDSDEDSDAEDSDSDDDDDKSGGILIPIFEWVKGIIPRVIPTPQS